MGGVQGGYSALPEPLPFLPAFDLYAVFRSPASLRLRQSPPPYVPAIVALSYGTCHSLVLVVGVH